MSVEKSFQDLIDANKWNELDRFDRYARSDFDPPYLPSVNRNQIANEYRDLLERADLGICALVVSAVVDRLQVYGFRNAVDADIDETVWKWWQTSKLDARQTLLYRDAMVFGSGFLSVTPGGNVPVYRPESPLNMVVKYDPTDPSLVMYAAKQVDDYGWFYDSEAIYGLRYDKTISSTRRWRIVSAIEHGAGATPIVRFANRVDSRGRDLSEISLVEGPQRRIIQTIADRLMVQRSASWRQRWISGIDIETDTDGNAVPPFRIGVDQLVVSENPDARFGEWSESPFDTHLKAVEEDIRHAAAVSQTPPHLLTPTSISNISADALVALEAGLTAKVTERQLQWGESLEYAMRLGGQMVGYEVNDEAEVLWKDLERRSDAQRVDGVLKLRSMGLPMRYMLERLGLSPQAIDRVMTEYEAENQRAARAAAAAYGLGSDASMQADSDLLNSAGGVDNAIK